MKMNMGFNKNTIVVLSLLIASIAAFFTIKQYSLQRNIELRQNEANFLAQKSEQLISESDYSWQKRYNEATQSYEYELKRKEGEIQKLKITSDSLRYFNEFFMTEDSLVTTDIERIRVAVQKFIRLDYCENERELLYKIIEAQDAQISSLNNVIENLNSVIESYEKLLSLRKLSNKLLLNMLLIRINIFSFYMMIIAALFIVFRGYFVAKIENNQIKMRSFFIKYRKF